MLGTPAAAPPPFALSRDFRRDCTVLAVSGQLDLSSAGSLADAVDDLIAGIPALRLVLDLAGLTFWDPFGLAALLRAQARVAGSPPARMILAAVPGPLAAHLRDSGLRDRFTLAESADEAVSELSYPRTRPAARTVTASRARPDGQLPGDLADYREHRDDRPVHRLPVLAAVGSLAGSPRGPYLVTQLLGHQVPMRPAHQA